MSNELRFEECKKVDKKISMGDLFTDASPGSPVEELYILARVNSLPGEFSAISLSTGNRWSGCFENIDKAVKGLRRVYGTVTITRLP